MPLSDNEQRLLQQMERALYAEDPKFASAMRGASRRNGAVRRLIFGGLGVIAGLALLLVGVASQKWWVGVVGFLIMLTGAAYALATGRRGGPTGVVGADGQPKAAKGKPAKRGIMNRLEDRWDRRRHPWDQ